MILGCLDIYSFLKGVHGKVNGCINTDGKERQYRCEYCFNDQNDKVAIHRKDGNGDNILLPKVIYLDESLIAFFGLYSGDGAKGSEDTNEPGRINPVISFSQKEKHLVRFAVDQFRRLFPYNITFTFSLGEDSAYFMADEGKDRLNTCYLETTGYGTPPTKPLDAIRPVLDSKDRQYLTEIRHDVIGSNEDHLAFYYQHKEAMEAIFIAQKKSELASVGIKPGNDIKVTASLRRPFKKGARQPGGSSRSDEIHPGGLNGIAELFLKIMHEIEDSILRDSQVSSQGLVRWNTIPSEAGNLLDILNFFSSNPFGKINRERPTMLIADEHVILGQWRRSSKIHLQHHLYMDPLWCYTSGLYLAEGSTPKEKLFFMFREDPGKLTLGFTSSEGTSLELMLRALRKVFLPDDCMDAWKVKVGNQYFPELVVTGLKHGVPMLRGGNKGEGKLRTMEISLALKQWALDVADSPLPGRSLLTSEYSERYSHVEPTGAGVARIDFWASSTLCRWYFPLVMYTVFGQTVVDPVKEFIQ